MDMRATHGKKELKREKSFKNHKKVIIMTIKIVSDGIGKKIARTFNSADKARAYVQTLRDTKGQLFLGLKVEKDTLTVRVGYPIVRNCGHAYYQMYLNGEKVQCRL